MKRNRKINFETYIQIRISKKLKEKIELKSKGGNASNYIRKLIEKDCKDLDDIVWVKYFYILLLTNNFTYYIINMSR